MSDESFPMTRVLSREERRSAAPVVGPWSLNGSNSVVEVGLTPNPSGLVQLQRISGSYPYPDTIPGIRIFRISRG